MRSDEPITDDHAKQVCKVGKGKECCRYIAMGAQGWSCEKGTTIGRIMDNRVQNGSANAQGDNCEGRARR